jgi:hypothetical protein
MSEQSKSIWKKPFRGPAAWFLGWLALMLAGLLVFLLFGKTLEGKLWYPREDMMLLGTFEAAVTFFVFFIAVVWWLRRWQNVKRFLFGAACAATVIALFYAEEDWRGRHAWRSYVNEWAAKGEHFEFKDIVPPPVSDDKNFAMAPVVVSCYDFILTTDGRIIPSEQRNQKHVNHMDFDLGDMNWETTNAIGYWAKGTLSRLDLWQQHYRELAAKTNQFAVPAQPGTPAADVLLALSKYDTAVEDIRKASQLPECRFPLDYDNEDPAAILLPHLAALKRTSQLLRVRALAELENGQSDKAAADVLLTFRLTDYIRNEPTYIGVLVRAAMMDIALQPVYEGLAKHQWTDAQLAAFGEELARQDYLVDFNMALRWERAFSSGIIDYLAKKNTRERYAELFGNFYEDEFNKQTRDDLGDFKAVGVAAMPSGWLDLNRLAIAKFHENYTLHMVDAEKHQVLPAATDEMASQLQHWNGTPANFMVRMFLASFAKGPHRFARIQSSIDLARVAVALERCRLAQGAYPETLDGLAPKYLDKVPVDVIGGQPLKYRLEADGTFTLYAVGWNGKDDGGVTGYAENGTAPNYDYGDWVWRYPR